MSKLTPGMIRRWSFFLFALFIQFSSMLSQAQTMNQKKDTTFKPSGKLGGYTFGDFFFKSHADPLGRDVASQYNGVPANRTAFQFRRVYLEYDYQISPKFSAQVLLAGEEANSDVLASNKFSFYIKGANLRWKDILPRTDLIFGQQGTPAFTNIVEPTWGYRSVEKSILDFRRLPSSDLGVSLQGRFDARSSYGYDLMVANGSGAAQENDNFKHFYGDLWAKPLSWLIIHFYGGYERINWTPTLHHARSMEKLFVAYTSPRITLGVEAFDMLLQGDVTATSLVTGLRDSINGNARGISVFLHGPILPNKLGFFARTDRINPDTRYNALAYSKFSSLSPQWDPNNDLTFCTAGLDWTPVPNVHFEPNLWYEHYAMKGPQGPQRNYDLAWRMTLLYIYK